MEVERVHDPRARPFSEIERIAFAIGIPHSPEQRHIGILYKEESGSETRTRMIHLAWHHDVRSEEPKDKYMWVQPSIHPTRARVLARLCKLLADKYRGRRPSIAYALRYEGGKFEPKSGNFLTETERGLTCATFVLAVFATRGVPLLRAEEWPPRQDDEVWQRAVVEILRSTGAEAEHVAAVEQEVGCARFRPEEVAAAGTSPDLPAPFGYASRVGEAIVARLHERANPPAQDRSRA
ncbi:hypothetical protein [Sorangium sp. So ce341]|uniref:hypothetical protein n=1 Tax=Sorangium sp. So ce341 TaxID=3133302 RepID=UPI003F5FD5D2